MSWRTSTSECTPVGGGTTDFVITVTPSIRTISPPVSRPTIVEGITTSEIGVVADGWGSIVITGILANRFDASTGKMLWESILGGNVSVSTISYAVNGKQYIAVMTGDNLKVPELSAEVPELKTPTGHNAIYVFALP